MLKSLLAENGYSSKKEISAKLIEVYTEQIQQLNEEIAYLEKNRATNVNANKLNAMLGAIPHDDDTDKILKYERSIQKSIFQNIFLLKKMQGFC